MIRFYAIFWAAALGIAVLAHNLTTDDAMATCQKTNSYDTCFQLLNR